MIRGAFTFLCLLIASVAWGGFPKPDARGNLHGVYDQRHFDFLWYSNRVTGYGAVPGHRPVPLGQGPMVDSASAWRGKWSDVTGLIWLGARYYDPEAGRFLSADPLGHGSDPSLYTFAGGDPINFFDPDGRLTAAAPPGTGLGTAPTSWGALLNPQLGYNMPAAYATWYTTHSRAGYAVLDQMNAAGAAAISQGQAESQAYWAGRRWRASLDAIDRRSEGYFNAMRAEDWLGDVGSYLGAVDSARRRAEDWAGVVYNARGSLSGPVVSWSWARSCRYDPTTTFENLLIGTAEWSLMALPGGGVARGAALAGRAGAFGLRAELAALGAAETASLAAPGARVTIGGVQATEIVGRMTPAQMAALQTQHGMEFAQIYLTGPGRAGGGGTYYLIQGSAGRVPIPIGPNVRLISHTHPETLQGGLVPLRASPDDFDVLRRLQQAGSPQRTSQIVPEVGTPFNFRR